VLIEASRTLERFMAILVGAFMSRQIVVLIANVNIKITFTLKGLVAPCVRAMKSLGFIEVMNVFDMLC